MQAVQRINEFIESQGISIRAFEQKIGASNGLIRKAITNKTDIQSKWLTYIVDNFPIIDSDWLLTGRGSMLRKEKTSTQSIATATITDRGETDAYYKMYKKKDAEASALKEEVGMLKERIRQLEARANEDLNVQQKALEKTM